MKPAASRALSVLAVSMCRPKPCHQSAAAALDDHEASTAAQHTECLAQNADALVARLVGFQASRVQHDNIEAVVRKWERVERRHLHIDQRSCPRCCSRTLSAWCSSLTTTAACPLSPTLAAIAPTRSESSTPICSARSPILRRSSRRAGAPEWTCVKNIEFRHDIVAACDAPPQIAPARGKLGVLLVGLGAVSTTTIAGVCTIRKGLAPPIGSLTQMVPSGLASAQKAGTHEFVPLADLNDIVFGGWDIFSGTAIPRRAAAGAGAGAA